MEMLPLMQKKKKNQPSVVPLVLVKILLPIMGIFFGCFGSKTTIVAFGVAASPASNRMHQRIRILVLIAYANSEGSEEPADPHSLARAFTAQTHTGTT